MSQLPYSYPIFIIFAPICREICMLSFEIVVILDWTSPLTKLLILVSFFSGEDTPSTDISRYIPTLPEVCRFFWPPV